MVDEMTQQASMVAERFARLYAAVFGVEVKQAPFRWDDPDDKNPSVYVQDDANWYWLDVDWGEVERIPPYDANTVQSMLERLQAGGHFVSAFWVTESADGPAHCTVKMNPANATDSREQAVGRADRWHEAAALAMAAALQVGENVAGRAVG